MGTGKKYILDGVTHYVQATHKHYQRGYYIMLLTYTIMDNGHLSHGNLIIENINSKDSIIIESSAENKNIVFEDSSLQEKLNIIIENRKKSKLSCIIHVNKFDAKNIKTIDITKTKNINNLIEKYKKSKEPLLLSGGMSWVEKQYTNFKTSVIHLDDLEVVSYNEMMYIHRSFEE